MNQLIYQAKLNSQKIYQKFKIFPFIQETSINIISSHNEVTSKIVFLNLFSKYFPFLNDLFSYIKGLTFSIKILLNYAEVIDKFGKTLVIGKRYKLFKDKFFWTTENGTRGIYLNK